MDDHVAHDGAEEPRPNPKARGGKKRKPPTSFLRLPRHKRSKNLGKKKTKSYLNIATQNLKGRSGDDMPRNKKWHRIASAMKNDKIGLFAVQETHLTDEHVAKLERTHEHLKFVNSPDPRNPTGAGGVAIVLNRRTTDTGSLKHWVIQKGRAIIASFRWHKDQTLTVLAIYAPTNEAENRELWKHIHDTLKKDKSIPRPQIVLGDFNFVEDAIDRFPVHMNGIDAPESFDDLKTLLHLTDGWRATFETETDYTWRNKTRTQQSRLDRIYMTNPLLATTRDWQISVADLPDTDHCRVMTKIVCLDVPEEGPGRWTMRKRILKNPEFIADVQRAGRIAEAQLDLYEKGVRTETFNPQTIWADFKKAVIAAARKYSSTWSFGPNKHVAELNRKRRAILNAHKQSVENEEDFDDEDALDFELDSADIDIPRDSREVEELIQEAYESMHNERRDKALTDKHLTAETTEKRWFSMAKEYKARDKILALKKDGPDGPVFVTRSDEMAELAREYHDGLQGKDIHENAQERRQAISEVLDHVQSIRERVDLSELERGTTEEDVAASLKDAKSGKAAGIDGLIYELWKELHRQFQNDNAAVKETVNIVRLMTALFRDIELNGLIEGSDFTDGWLCPLYKKGERTNIANYRPITLLNTDYKIYTKALAMKLAKIAPDIVHCSQAGFVKGRDITDHIHLARMMVTYAEADETENGMILALDQEKAYDKIAHDYLHDVLVKMELPDIFTSTVQSLYSQAKTVIIINGEISSPFRVKRGVRQGDPLSCLLFNFAIEPLATMLRASTLRGWDIPGQPDRLIAILYADDTSIFLRDDDSFEELNRILDTWCMAATAKFNKAKTECIPLGDKAYRQRLIQHRTTTEGGVPLPLDVKIANDGTAVRILGGWIGNELDDATPWSPIMDKARARLERWQRFFPTNQGRRILCRCIIGGMTQYLTAAQGMPKQVEDRFVKLLMDFFWDNRKHTVNEATMYLPESDGGMNVLDIRARNEAIYAVWAKKLFTGPTDAPIWKGVANEILRRHATKASAKDIPARLRQSPMTQNWHPAERKLPIELRCIENLRRTYGIAMDAPLLPYEVRTEMPIWGHIARETVRRRGRRPNDAKEASICLKNVHEVVTVGDMMELALQTNPDHEMDSPNCICDDCESDREIGCENPARCQSMAQDIIATLPEKWNPFTAQTQDELELTEEQRSEIDAKWKKREVITFDPATNDSPEGTTHVRIFTKHLALAPASAADLAARDAGIRPEQNRRNEEITAYVYGDIRRSATDDATGVYAVYFPNWEILSETDTLRDETPDAERAALTAIIRACCLVDTSQDLLLVSSNKHVARNLTVSKEAMEADGWADRPKAATLYRHAIALLRSRGGRTRIKYTKPQDQDSEMREARDMAQDKMNHESPEVRTRLPVSFDTPGAKLETLSQRKAYRAIRMIKASSVPIRTAAKVGLDRARHAALQFQDTLPTDEEIWNSMKHQDLPRKLRDFLWLSTHDGQRTGNYFLRMTSDQWKACADCKICDVPDTLEHVLLVCDDPTRTQIWDLARQTWQRIRNDWPTIAHGTILASGLINVKDADGKVLPGPSRLLRILISEAAHLIWCLNRERVIKYAHDPDWRQPREKVEAAWYSRLNDRLTVDRLGTNRYRYGHRTLDKKLVLQTWKGLIENEAELPADWTKVTGVLVGRGNLRPAGRNR